MSSPRPPADAPEPVQAPLERPVTLLIEPFQEFVGSLSAAGWLLLGATVLAIVAANSPWSGQYEALKHIELGLVLAGEVRSLSLLHLVNDGLMGMFFFLLGLELKREVLVGRLSEPRRSASVLSAALGGMIVPAVIFLALVRTPEARAAWAIPMATDTAFALMILVMLRDHVPRAARAFLVGLAIVDDLGAILVIALFYSRDLDLSLALPAAAAVAVIGLMNLAGIRRAWPYVLAGGLLWVLFQGIGLHGTLAGVAAALLAPVRPALSRGAFAEYLRDRISRFYERHDEQAETILESAEQHEIAADVMDAARQATVPLKRWENTLERPISFIVLPVFAFFNAGVAMDPAAITATWQHPLSYGVLAVLLLGKPLGILLGVGLGRAGGAVMPEGLLPRHLFGLGLLGAIGFTMSLFIATLSFSAAPHLLEAAKQSVILTSLAAGAGGFLWLRCTSGANPEA